MTGWKKRSTNEDVSPMKKIVILQLAMVVFRGGWKERPLVTLVLGVMFITFPDAICSSVNSYLVSETRLRHLRILRMMQEVQSTAVSQD